MQNYPIHNNLNNSNFVVNHFETLEIEVNYDLEDIITCPEDKVNVKIAALALKVKHFLENRGIHREHISYILDNIKGSLGEERFKMFSRFFNTTTMT